VFCWGNVGGELGGVGVSPRRIGGGTKIFEEYPGSETKTSKPGGVHSSVQGRPEKKFDGSSGDEGGVSGKKGGERGATSGVWTRLRGKTRRGVFSGVCLGIEIE